MKLSYKIAFGGAAAAFSAVLMIAGSMISTVHFTFAAVAGIPILALSYIQGNRWAFFSFIAAAAVSAFLCTDRQATVSFILFFGYYPLVREEFNKLRYVLLAAMLKLVVFNAAAFVACFIFSQLFSADMYFAVSDQLPEALIVIILNGAFFCYEMMLYFFEKEYKQRIIHIITKSSR